MLSEFVYSVEVSLLNKELAIKNLTHAGVNNVSIVGDNGIDGLRNKAPYDKIFIGGGLLNIPENIKTQLKVGGILVGFVGSPLVMHAIKIEKISENEYKEIQLF